MRPVLHGDLTSAARALLPVPRLARNLVAMALLERADWADRYRKRTGRAHPAWGDGTLMALVRKRPLPPEPSVQDADYCACLRAVLGALAVRRAEGTRRARGQND